MEDWKAKEYYTVQLDRIPVDRLAGFLRGTLGLSEETAVRSQFYTKEADDLAYSDSFDLAAYFAGRCSASVHMKTVCFDRAYRDGTCVICSDGTAAELECDIEEKDFDTQRVPALEAWLTEQIREGIAEYACISYTFDKAPLFEIRKGDLS